MIKSVGRRLLLWKCLRTPDRLSKVMGSPHFLFFLVVIYVTSPILCVKVKWDYERRFMRVEFRFSLVKSGIKEDVSFHSNFTHGSKGSEHPTTDSLGKDRVR